MLFCLDVAIVTSLRDGMNLVSYEFVACQEEKKGVLILSEVRKDNHIDFYQPVVSFTMTENPHIGSVMVWDVNALLNLYFVFYLKRMLAFFSVADRNIYCFQWNFTLFLEYSMRSQNFLSFINKELTQCCS